MIVKCENCQTRFRIPDEKVTEKGVKVRCTKCSHTFRVSKPPADAAGAAPPSNAAAADPFAQFAPAASPPPAQSTRPGVFADGIAATRSASSQPAAQPADLSDLFGGPPPDAPPPPAPVATRRGEAPPSAPGQDFSQLFGEPTRVGQAPPPPAPAQKKAPATQTAAKNLAQASRSVPAPKPAPTSSAPLDLDFGGPPSLADAPPGPTAPAPAHGSADPFASGPSASGLLADLPPPDDLFGSMSGPGAQLTTSGSAGALELGGAPDRALFDLPPPPASGAPSSDAFAPPPEAPLSTGITGSVPLARMTKPKGKAEDARGLEETKPGGAAKRFSGLIANISIAAALVVVLLTVGGVYLNEGKLELGALSVDRVKELVFPTRTIVTRDVSNGLYETLSGRPVFFVRGEVENRGEQPDRAKVRAEILDGPELIRAAEGFAGTIPTPEELYRVRSAEELQQLSARLDHGARPVTPGARLPFLLVFYEYPPDLTPYRLRVSVVSDPQGETAAKQ